MISGASAGATSALVIDAVFHGMTFGAAALTGGLIGAAIGALAGGFYSARYDEKFPTLTVKSTRGTLRALYWRGLGAATACHFRGRAGEQGISWHQFGRWPSAFDRRRHRAQGEEPH